MLLMLHHSCDVQQSPLCSSIIHFVTAIHDVHERTWMNVYTHTTEDKSVVRNVTNLRKRWKPTITTLTNNNNDDEKNDNEKNRPKRNEKWRWSEMMTAIKLRVSRMDCSRIMSARESLVYFWGLGPYQVWYYNTSKCLCIYMIQWTKEWMNVYIHFYVMHLGKVSINGGGANTHTPTPCEIHLKWCHIFMNAIR